MSDNNVKVTVIQNNRGTLSAIGKNFGCQFYRPEARQNILDFDKNKAEVERNGNIELITNRATKRFRVIGNDVQSMSLGQDIAGAPVVFINKGLNSETVLPISPDLSKVGKVTEDAVSKALRGDKSIIFSDVEALVKTANIANQSEISKIDNLIASLQKEKQSIVSAIEENNKKCEVYLRELSDSNPANVEVTIEEQFMEKLVSKIGKLLIQTLLCDSKISETVLENSNDAEKYKICTIQDNGTIVLGKTSYIWWNRILGCQDKIPFDSFALKIWNALADSASGMNKDAIIHGLSREIIENAVRRKDYNYVVQRLYDCWRFVANKSEGYNQALSPAGGPGSAQDCPEKRHRFETPKNIVINVNGEERKIPIIDSTGKPFNLVLNYGFTGFSSRK